MNKTRRATLLGPIVAVFIAAMAVPPRAQAYYDKVHRAIAGRALDLVERTYGRNGVYGELLRYRDRILEGAVAEDYGAVAGNERSMRHYYDPDARRAKKGVPYFAWYHLWQVKGAQVWPPLGGYYDGAMDWARDGCGTGDNLNWSGAIRYYAGQSRSHELAGEAFLRLGHVVHLLTDMTIYDHVVNIPHPGSYRSDFLKEKYGFEGFCEAFFENYARRLRGEKISRFRAFEDYFNQLARMTKAESAARGLMAPLGLKGPGIPLPGNQLVSIDEFNKLQTDYFMRLDVAWEPDIDVAKDGPMYTEYAVMLLNRAVESCAGLMLDFCDLVRKPLFVENVLISGQRGGLYQASWEESTSSDLDGAPRILSRRLVVEDETPLDNRSPVTIKFRFDADGSRTEEAIDAASIKVRIAGSDGKVIDAPPERLQGGEGGDRPAWQATFVPELTPRIAEAEYRLEISATEKASRRGAAAAVSALDANPGSPFRVDPSPPYGSSGFEPGPDTFHKFRVVRGSNSMIAMPAYILVRPAGDGGKAGELVIASYPSEGDTTVGGPFLDAVALYKTLCPFLDDLRRKGYVMGETRVSVPKAYLEKCDLPGFELAADRPKETEPASTTRPGPETSPPSPPATPPKAQTAPGLNGPRTLAEVPAVIKNMGFQIRKTEGCGHGTCYSAIIVNRDVAARFGFESGAIRLLGATFGGEESYDGIFWGEMSDGEVSVWVDWLDKSYVPKERSFPPFVRLFKR